jgi:CRISPR-associated protein Csm3
MTLKLIGISRVSASLSLRTGLHIGAGDLQMRIGGIDNPVVKHPVTDLPYIPGSSLKGKIRALLEWSTGALVGNSPLGLKQADQPGVREILMLFGIGGGETDVSIGPSRLAIADCELAPEYADRGRNQPLFEAKFENSINRIEGTATNPRQTERVVAGTRFLFEASIRRFEGDPDLVHLLLRGMALLERDALGGSGSRGYGKVRFEDIAVDGAPRALPADPFATAA